MPSYICKTAIGIKQSKTLNHGDKETKARQKCISLVTQAIKKGILIPQPCEVCGCDGITQKGKRKVHAHHDDYLKPLEVRWLCPSHHRLWHARNNPKTAFIFINMQKLTK